MSISISLRLTNRLDRELKRLSRTMDRSKSYLIERAIETFIADYADYQIALDRLRDKDDEIITSSELKSRLGR